MAILVSVAWLGMIVADRQWWQLVAWVVFVPIGIAAPLAARRLPTQPPKR
jgi:hypothetical protein